MLMFDWFVVVEEFLRGHSMNPMTTMNETILRVDLRDDCRAIVIEDSYVNVMATIDSILTVA
jgi:hypothetical protein